MSQILFCKHGNNKMDFDPCQKCCREKILIEQINEIVAEKGGLWFYDNSEKIIMKSRQSFLCKNNHIWETNIFNIKKGRWCMVCYRSKSGINIAQKIAEERNGRCLSEEYVVSKYHLMWQCYFQHVWFASLSNVKKGTWCPKCNINIGEEITRKIFEILFDTKFIKIRPKWLNGLELDGYCEKLNLAFEYDGIQHYKFIKYFHKTKEEFHKRKGMDNIKNDLCIKNNITLLRIPYYIKFDDIKNYIITLCNNNKIIIPNDIDINHEDFKDIYKLKENKLKEVQKIIENKGGTLLSNVYINSKTKLRVECGKGHIWEINSENIKYDYWCPYCARNKKHTIEKMQEFAKSKNGKCLSKEYVNDHTKILWQCEYTHQWMATASNILQGRWCPTCGKGRGGRPRNKKNNNYVEV